MASNTAADYVYLGGRTRRYLDTTTGQTLSRRAYDARFKLSTQGFRSYEAKALARSRVGPEQEPARPSTIAKYYRVAKRLAAGESLAAATRAEHLSPSTAWRLNEERGVISKMYRPGKRGGKAVFDRFSVRYAGTATFWTSDGVRHDAVSLDQKNLRLLARYQNAQKQALETGDEQRLQAYAGTPMYDLHGNVYHLLTDLNALYAVHDALLEEDIDWDALFQSGEGVLHAA
jgi:hypothetical protein